MEGLDNAVPKIASDLNNMPNVEIYEQIPTHFRGSLREKGVCVNQTTLCVYMCVCVSLYECVTQIERR